MSPQPKSTIVELVQKLGLPTALLIVLCWWLAHSVAEPVIASHTQFLAAQIENTKTATATLERLSRVIEGQAETLSRIEEGQREHSRILGRLVDKQIGQSPGGAK